MNSGPDIFSLVGRVALVTGASRGIGAAIALAFANAGAQVYGLSRTGKSGLGNPVSLYSCDVGDTGAVNEIVQRIIADRGKIDVLVNAAGVSLPPGDGAANGQAFDQILHTNLAAVFRVTQAVLPYMSSGASIVNIGSLGSIFGFSSNPGYVASKAGVVGLTRALAVDLGIQGIRVNCIIPGYIRTDMTAKSSSDPKLSQDRISRTVLGRWGEPEDLAGAALFLASSASSYVTGSVLTVDGGWSAKGL